MWSRLAFIGAFLFLLTDGAAALAADPPGRVGRLSLIEGTVSLRSPQPVNTDGAAGNTAAPELKDEWTPATLNYPVTGGNSLWTESGAKAELQVGPAEIRLNEQTELEVLRLDDRSIDLALHQGTANVHIGDAIPGGLLIDTPRGPVTLTQPGSYRIDVETGGDAPADSVQVTAFDGEAKVSVETPERTDTHTVTRGQSLKLSGEPIEIALADARATAFDDWARSRDPRAVAAARPQTAAPTVSPSVSPTVSPVSTQMTGYQDLAPYGTWESAPTYGAVWYPATVTPDWAPYRYGHWAYVVPWGWTWIDDAPWGFTPFHYGRWIRVGPRWAWWPGHRTVRPVYAPALVAFVGGSGWSVSITSGRARPVGWVPLAPYEVYRPHYRTSATYIRNVNITTVNKTVIKNITVNKNVEVNKYANRTAVTAVPADTFARGRKVNEAKIDVSRRQIEHAKVTSEVRAIKPVSVAVKADQPRPVARKDDNRRPNPAITSREQDRTKQRRDPAIERRNAALRAAPQNRNQDRSQPHGDRRDAAPRPAQKPAQQAAPAPAAKEPAKERVREPAATPQARPQQQREQRPARETPSREERRATPPQEREQQRREQARERRPDERSSTRPDQPRAQPQPRQQVEQQQRRQEADVQQRRQRAEAQQRDEQHQRRQQVEQRQRQHAEQQRAQDQQRRQQAENQRRQQAEQQRQVQEQQRRAQVEQQQRAQQDQQRQQREQAQQQQRQRQEQAREEQRRRAPEKREERRERAG